MTSKETVLVTGANSMIGKHTCNELDKKYIVYEGLHSNHDLLLLDECRKLFEKSKPDYVVNLCGFNGNISFSQKYPADIFYKTTQLALNVLYCCQEFNVKKVVSLISSCALPEKNERLKSEDLWNGLPNDTIEAHGLAKRTLHAYSRQLYKQYGLNSVCMIVNNSFGEWDNTDIFKTKAVMGIIKRIVDAHRQNLPSITCWGSGNVYREFIYAGDVAKCILEVLEKYNDSMNPINISTPYEVTIKDLTNMIAKIVGYKGTIEWDLSKPDGQKRKSLDISKMRDYIRSDFTPLEEALRDTVSWYKRATR